MARIWPYESAVPAPRILALRDEVLDAARELWTRGHAVRDHRLMAMAEDLYAWGVCLERMATSSPTYHSVLARMDPEHPRHDEPVEDRLIPHRLQADFLGFVAIGDLVLNQIARLWLRAWRDTVPRDAEAFPRFLRRCDRDDVEYRVKAAARSLQLSLRSARNRLLAHAQADHAEIRAWDLDDAPSISLISIAPPAEQLEAVRTMNEALRPPLAPDLIGDPRRAVEVAASAPSQRTAKELFAIDSAMRVVGFLAVPVEHVVRDVLALARPIQAQAERRRIELLWLEGCGNVAETREMILEVVASLGIDAEFDEIEASDPDLARLVRFAGSPSVRVDGRDIEPGFTGSEEYAPSCRLYHAATGLTGIPERSWLELALAEDGES